MSESNKINFTKATLQALSSPATGRDTYHDVKTPGLQLRVTPTGVKTFSVYHRVKGGGPTRVTLGKFPEMSIERARLAALSCISELASGTDVAERQRQARAVMTFGDLFAQYMERHSKVHKRSWTEDERNYHQHLADPLGRKKLSAIARKDIAQVHSTITSNGHATTANRVLALISSVYSWALSADLWSDNPTAGVRKNPERSRERFIQGAELPYFFMSLNAEPNDTIRDFFLLSLLTGARRANVLEMAWRDLNLDERQWHIPRTKNGDAQTVILVPLAVDTLERRRGENDGSPFVFPGAGVTGHLVEPKVGWLRLRIRMAGLYLLEEMKNLFRWSEDASQGAIEAFLAESSPEEGVEKLCVQIRDAGHSVPEIRIPDLRIHDLRRTLGSWQAKTGASMVVIGKSLNHRSTNTTAIYARLDTDPVRESVTRATDEILRAGLMGNDDQV